MPLPWQASQTSLTPEGIERQRRLAEALMVSGMDASPVQHWTQGAARLAQALAGTYNMNKAETAAAALKRQQDLQAATEKAQSQMLPDWTVVAGQGIYDMNPRRNPTPLMVQEFQKAKEGLTDYQSQMLDLARRRQDFAEKKFGTPAGVPNAVRTKNLEIETASKNLENALDDYDKLIGQTGYARIGQERDAVDTSRRNIQMQMKELYNLGVLNGPDLQLMNEMLVDPTYSLGATFNPFSDERGALGVLANEVGGMAGQGTDIRGRVSANVKRLKDQFRSIVEQRKRVMGSAAAGAAPELDGPALDNRYETMTNEEILRELGQ